MENNLQVEAKGEPAISSFKGDVEGGFLLAPVNGEEANPLGVGEEWCVHLWTGWIHFGALSERSSRSMRQTLGKAPALPQGCAPTVGHKQADNYTRKTAWQLCSQVSALWHVEMGEPQESGRALG